MLLDNRPKRGDFASYYETEHTDMSMARESKKTFKEKETVKTMSQRIKQTSKLK